MPSYTESGLIKQVQYSASCRIEIFTGCTFVVNKLWKEENEMEKYISPAMDVKQFNEENITTASGGSGGSPLDGVNTPGLCNTEGLCFLVNSSSPCSSDGGCADARGAINLW